MKIIKTVSFALSLLFIFAFSSCVEDEIKSVSCLEFDKISQGYNILETAVFTTKIIEFEIYNTCPYKIKITDIKIRGKNASEFTIQGIAEGTYLTDDKLKFNILFSPKSLGKKEAGLTIFHEFGSIVMHLSGTGI